MGRNKFLEEVSKEAKSPSESRFDRIKQMFKSRQKKKENDLESKKLSNSELIEQERERTYREMSPEYNPAVDKYEQEQKRKRGLK